MAWITFFAEILKIDFFNSGRILRFSHPSFDGLRCGTSQMIENFFLYKIAYFNNFLNAIFYEKEIKFEKQKCSITVIKFQYCGQM
jgi:hypothetical protein